MYLLVVNMKQITTITTTNKYITYGYNTELLIWNL